MRGGSGRRGLPDAPRRTPAEVEQDVYADAGVTLDDELGTLSRRTFKRECSERSVTDVDALGRRYLAEGSANGSIAGTPPGARASVHVMLPVSGPGSVFPKRGDRLRIAQRLGSVNVIVLQVYSHPRRKTTGVLLVRSV